MANKPNQEEMLELFKGFLNTNSSNYFAFKYFCESKGFSIKSFGVKEPVFDLKKKKKQFINFSF